MLKEAASDSDSGSGLGDDSEVGTTGACIAVTDIRGFVDLSVIAGCGRRRFECMSVFKQPSAKECSLLLVSSVSSALASRIGTAFV